MKAALPNKDLDDIYKEAAAKFKLPKTVIEETFESFYEMIRITISTMDKADIKTYHNFNLPKLGKIYISDKKKAHLTNVIFNKDHPDNRIRLKGEPRKRVIKKDNNAGI